MRPRAFIQELTGNELVSHPMQHHPVKHKLVLVAALSALAMPLFTTGCEKTVSENKKTTVSDDGSSKTKDTTVTQEPDGSVKKTQETTKTAPSSQ